VSLPRWQRQVITGARMAARIKRGDVGAVKPGLNGRVGQVGAAIDPVPKVRRGDRLTCP
jgi:hypothetical protein